MNRLSTPIKERISWVCPLLGAALTFALVVFFFNSFDKAGVLRQDRREFIIHSFMSLWVTSIVCFLLALIAPGGKRPFVLSVSIINFLVTFVGLAIFGAGE